MIVLSMFVWELWEKYFPCLFYCVCIIGTFLSNQKMHSKKCVNMLANSSLDSTQTSVNQKLYSPHILDPARSPDSLSLCSDTTGSIQKNTHRRFWQTINVSTTEFQTICLWLFIFCSTPSAHGAGVMPWPFQLLSFLLRFVLKFATFVIVCDT